MPDHTVPPLPPLSAQTRVHLVGIGGTGLSAIARVLLERGIPVSGSDRALNPVTDQLTALGATVHAGHHADHVSGAALVLMTSAAKPDNPEIAAARAAGIPVVNRRHFLPSLLGADSVIGVAGTHGKTTTTAMTAHILIQNGRKPSYIVGSVMQNTGTNASGGAPGEPFVIEADEYDDMYLGLTPQVAVLTSTEWDHPDYFPTEADMQRSFSAFVAQIQPGGVLIASADTPHSRALADGLRGGAVTPISYSRAKSAEADWHMDDLRATPDGLTHFEAVSLANNARVPFTLRVPGEHNALNALAAALAAAQVGVPLAESAAALATFESTGRRFELRGERDGVLVVDDYGHHPSAIKVTLEAAKMRYPDRAIWAVWQPHTFSRTQALLDDYARCFGAADGVAVMDIYASREQAVPGGITAQAAVDAISAHHRNAHHTGNIDQTIAALREKVTAPAVVIVFSAGDAPAVSTGLLRP